MTVRDNVWIVDPDEESRAAATRLVWAAGMQSRASSHGTAFLGAFNEDLPACVVLETRIPGTKGLEVQKHLGRGPYCPQIVFVTALRDVPAIVHAMKAGAFHFLEKPVQNRLFLEVIRQAVARDQLSSEGDSPIDGLSPCGRTNQPRAARPRRAHVRNELAARTVESGVEEKRD